tara:strand:+ start:435 stop:593 length:159 start_codon:yes stop_codon:yes gene_type:complete
MAKESKASKKDVDVKHAVKEVVEEPLAAPEIFLHESGQYGYMDEHNNFIPQN